MKWKIFLSIAFLLTACAPAMELTSAAATLPPDSAVTSPPDHVATNEPMKNPFAPQPEDANLVRGNVFIEESGILIRESYPPQISLTMSGNLPNPCHELRVAVNPPDADHKIKVDVYSVVDPNLMCTEVLKPFTESIDLGIFPTGHYTVWVNGESVGEFDA
jgi:hypothetical protein